MFRNTLVVGGGWAGQNVGALTFFDMPEGRTKKFSVVKGGSKIFDQIDSRPIIPP